MSPCSTTQRIRDAESQYMNLAKLAAQRAKEIDKLKAQIKRVKERLKAATAKIEGKK